MKQVYSRPTFIPQHIIQIFSDSIQSLNSLLLRGSVSVLVLALSSVFCFAQDSGKSQKTAESSGVKMIAGKWIVKDADINMLVELHDTLQLKKENCFWADHLTKGIPLEIGKNGNVSYSAFGQPASSKVKIEDGNLIFMFFDGLGKEMGVPVADTYSYTTYSFQLNGNQMTLSREDGMVTEKYTFERK